MSSNPRFNGTPREATHVTVDTVLGALKEASNVEMPIKGAVRYDTDKPKMELISPLAMIGLAKVLTKGAKKYASHNWRKGMDWSRCIGSLERHLAAFKMGYDWDIDPNCDGCKKNDCKNHTGERHVDQIQCNAMFLSEYSHTHPELDDRYKLNEILDKNAKNKALDELAQETEKLGLEFK